MTTPPPDRRIGTDLGPYRIESVIGRGGMGVVYLATHTGLDRKVALKLLTPDYADDEAFRARFLRESKLAASIDHPNIIPVYDAGQIEGTFYLAMRYVEGTDLQQRLREGPLEPRPAAAILTQVASALDAAHAAGLVHRDVKPANILIAHGQGTDGADHAYLTDFGLTRQRGAQSELTQMGGFLGTIDYIAPEQIEGREVDGQADQYALAGVAVIALTGNPPFPRDSDVAVINAHLHDAPPSLRDRREALPAPVDAVVTRAMAKAPADRYPSCGAFVAALRVALGVTATTDRPLAVPDGSRPRWLLAAGVVGIAVIVVAAIAAALGAANAAPDSSPSESLGLVSPSPSVATSSATTLADSSAFPTADERAALALLPTDLQPRCVRGGGTPDATSAGFDGKVRLLLSGSGIPNDVRVSPPAPSASLTCSPHEGAARVHFLWYKFVVAADASSNTRNTIDFLSLLGVRYKTPEGDCKKDEKARSSWSNERLGSGLVVCFRTAPFDGAPWVDWTFADAHMLALATRDDRDYDTLYAWFQDLRTFLP